MPAQALRATNQITLSVVVPCFNEQEVIEVTHRELCAVLAGREFALELIYVNDGSSDNTHALLESIVASCPSAKLISLSRNFGHQIAVTAGLDHASGEAVVIIDADLQDPPNVVLQMLEKWQQGYDVVYGQRTERPQESWFKLASARFFYRLINRMSDTEIPLNTGDFRLLDRQVVEALNQMPERDRFLRGMIAWAGFRQVAVPYKREPRQAGQSKYPLSKMLRFAVDGIISFSAEPLRMAIWVGALISSLAVIGIAYAILMRLFTDHWVSGWTFTVVTMLLLGGIQLLFLGIIGEYIARIYQQGKERPLYFVAHRQGFEEETPS